MSNSPSSVFDMIRGQGLGEAVGGYIFGIAIFQQNILFFNNLANSIIFNINMFNSSMKSRIFNESNNFLVVGENNNRAFGYSI